MLVILLYFPTSFVRNERPSSCIDGSCTSRFETLSVLGVAARTSFLALVWLPCPSSTFTGLTGISQILQKIFPRAPRMRNTKLTGLAFVLVSPSANLHWKSLLDLSLTWRSAFRSDQKENCWKWLQENIEKLIILNKRRRWFHAWNSLWLACQQVGFWCQHIWFGSSVPNQFCGTTNQAQLCGFWTRVSIVGLRPLIIILMTASLSSKMYNWDSPLRRVCVCVCVCVCWWVLNPHLTIAQPLAFSFQLANGFLPCTSFL